MLFYKKIVLVLLLLGVSSFLITGLFFYIPDMIMSQNEDLSKDMRDQYTDRTLNSIIAMTSEIILLCSASMVYCLCQQREYTRLR